MSKNSTSKIFIDDDMDEYPEVTQADIDRSVFRKNLKPAGNNRVLVSIDSDIVEIFKTKAGNRDFQQLINETLRKAVAA